MRVLRPALSALLAVMFLTAGCFGPRAGRQYMPLAVGNRWDYRVTLSDGRTRQRRMTVTAKISELTYRTSDGGDSALWSWEDGFLSFQQGGRRVYLLALPPTEGSGWWTVTPEGARVWCKVKGRGEVSVPAGDFRNCVEVLMQPAGGKTEMRHWFAPGVGWVRYSYGPRGAKPWMVRELVAYELKGNAK